MKRFVNINGYYINTDFVKEFWRENDGELKIAMSDDLIVTVPRNSANFVQKELMGEYFFTQVISAQDPVYAVFREDDGSYSSAPVHYLAVCADGCIRGVDCDGFFDFFDNASNFEGIFPEDRLSDFGIGKQREAGGEAHENKS